MVKIWIGNVLRKLKNFYKKGGEMKNQIILLLIFLLSFSGFTQENTVELGEIVITAKRMEEEVEKTPANVIIIDEEEIKSSGLSTLPEILEKKSGIHWRSFSGNPSQAQIDLRGYGEQSQGKVLILLDGRRLNPPDMAQIEWLQIPLENIERIEIIRGSNTVLYGDNAVGGVINIITKKGQGKPTLTISPVFGSFNFNNQRISFSGGDNKFSYLVTGEHLSTSGWRERTGFNTKGGSINLAFGLKENLTVNLNLSGLSEYYEMPGGLTKEQMEANPRQALNLNDDAEYDFLNAGLGIEADINSNNKFQINFAYGRRDGGYNMESWFSFVSSILETFAITPRFISTNPLLGKENKFILGIDFYNQPLKIKQYLERERINLFNEANVRKKSTGFYFQNDFYITENLILALGGRYENACISAQDTNNPLESKDFEGIAYKSSFTYFVPEKTKIFFKYDRIYRYPFTDEIAYYYGFAPVVFFNKDLKPEKGNSFELGTEIYSLKNLKLGLSIFYNIIEDEIFYNPLTWMNENIGRTKRFGIEFKGDWKLTDFIDFHWIYTYIDAKLDYEPYENKRIPLVPVHKGVVGLTFNLPKDFSLSTNIVLTDDFYLGGDYDNNQEPIPGWTTFDIFLNYKPKKFEKNGLSIYFGIENLFNKIYSNYGFEGWSGNIYYPASGRNIKGGISFKF